MQGLTQHDRNGFTGRRLHAALLALFGLALLPLFATPVLPLIDFYNHVARYYVLAHPDAVPAFAASYRPHWAILPNIGLDVLATGAMRVLPLAVVPHLIIISLLGLLYSGLLAFNRALTGRLSLLVALFAVPLLYSFILNRGFANFLLGLGLMFWALAWWLRTRDRPVLAVPTACLLATIIFFAHGLAFALYGLVLGCLEIGLFLSRPDRRLSRLLRAMPPLVVQAVIPVLLFLAARTSQSPDGLTNADESIGRLQKAGALGARLVDLAGYRLTTIVRVAEGPSLAFDMLTMAAMVLILIVMVNRGLIRIVPLLWPAIALAAVLVVITPPALFGVGYVADRMPLLLALLFVAGISARPPRGRTETMLMSAVGLLVGLRLVAIAVSWMPYAADEADFRAVASRLPAGQLVEVVWPSEDWLEESRRCQMFAPRLVSDFHAVGRLFAKASQQPLDITGPLQAAMAQAISREPEVRRQPDYFDRAVASAVPAGFDAVLVCDAGRLTRPFPPDLAVAARAGRFTLLVPRR